MDSTVKEEKEKEIEFEIDLIVDTEDELKVKIISMLPKIGTIFVTKTLETCIEKGFIVLSSEGRGSL